MRRFILLFLLCYFLLTTYSTVSNQTLDFSYMFPLDSPELTACEIHQPIDDDQTQCRVRIGIINSFTDRGGACYSGGTEHKRGYELALQEIKQVNGCQLQLVQVDDIGNNDRASDAVATLAAANVSLIMGAYSSGATLAAADEANRLRVPLIVPSASSELVTSMGYGWVFRINATSEDYVAQALALTATLNDAPSVGILYENTVFGESAAVAITAQAEDLGVSIVAYQAFQPGTLAGLAARQDDKVALQATRIRAAKPDVIFLVASNVDDARNLLRISRRNQFQPQLFIGVAGAFVSPDFLQGAGPEVEHLVVTAQWSEDTAWQAQNGNDTAQFIANFRAAYDGEEPGMRSVQTYTALFVAKAAIEAAGQTPNCLMTEIEGFRRCVRDALRAITLPQTLFGAIDFDNTSGQNSHQVLLLQAVKMDDRYRFVTIYPQAYQRQPVILERK